MDYIVFTEPVLGKITEKRMNFKITRQKTVKMHIEVDKWKVDLILQNILYIS